MTDDPSSRSRARHFAETKSATEPLRHRSAGVSPTGAASTRPPAPRSNRPHAQRPSDIASLLREIDAKPGAIQSDDVDAIVRRWIADTVPGFPLETLAKRVQHVDRAPTPDDHATALSTALARQRN